MKDRMGHALTMAERAEWDRMNAENAKAASEQARLNLPKQPTSTDRNTK